MKYTVMPSVPTPHLSFKVPHRPGLRTVSCETAKATGKLLVLALETMAPASMRAAFPGRQSPLRAHASRGDAFPERRICQPSFNIGTGSLEQTSPVLAESVTYTGVFCQTTRRFCLENENLMKSHKYKSSIHLSKNGFFVGILFYRRFSLRNTEKMFICSICQKGS